MAKKVAKKEIKNKTKLVSKKEKKSPTKMKLKAKSSIKMESGAKAKLTPKTKSTNSDKINSKIETSSKNTKIEKNKKTLKSFSEVAQKKNPKSNENKSNENKSNSIQIDEKDDNISDIASTKKIDKSENKSETKKIKIDRTGMTLEEAFWADYYEKFQREPAQIYKMSGVFLPNRPLEHKTLGWGFILSIENDRLEVIFRSGKKILISNYK